MTTVSSHRIEVLEDGPNVELGERLVEFWVSRGVLGEADARDRLEQVLCVAYGPEDDIVGVNSAYPGTAPLIRREFWMYRRFVLPRVPGDVQAAMLKAAYDELARRFVEGAGGPAGVCAILSDPAEIGAYPDAVWDTGFVYAGYTDAGEQVRVAYFQGAVI